MKIARLNSFVSLLLAALLLMSTLLFTGCQKEEAERPPETLSEDAKRLLADVGLTPDAEGIYTLSEDADKIATQIQCIYSDDVFPYVQDTVFRIRGEIGFYKTVEDPTTYMTIDFYHAEGESAYRIEAVNPDRKVDEEVADYIMSGDREYMVTGTFGYFKVEHRDNEECPMFFADSYEHIHSIETV